MSPIAPALLRLVRAQGKDPALLVEKCGLPGDAETREELALTPPSLETLLEACSSLLGEPFLALRLPDALPLRRYGLAELAAHASSTVRDGLQRTARYAALTDPQLELVLEEEAVEARWRHRTRGAPRGVGRHVHELALSSALTHCRRESGQAMAALRVWFIHPRPRDLGPLRRFFGTNDLGFGRADNGFALPAHLLDLPTVGGDQRLLATAIDLAESALREHPRAHPQDFAGQVAALLRPLLTADPSIEAVARALHMSPRTLQRRLGDENTRFSDVLDELRHELARRWLVDRTLPLAEIGYRLGFADLATFSRAFKRWTGHPPGTWRR